MENTGIASSGLDRGDYEIITSASIPKTTLNLSDEKKNELKEKLAGLCHKQWSIWMKYLFSKCEVNIGYGMKKTLVIPDYFVERWLRQMNTDYKDLNEVDKDSDREEADKFIDLVLDYLK
jgi:hypothetical protein